jgi:hypothetical protein
VALPPTPRRDVLVEAGSVNALISRCSVGDWKASSIGLTKVTVSFYHLRNVNELAL